MTCAPLTERKLIAVTLRRPWAALVAFGLCPVISLPEAPEYLWGDYVAVHAGLGEDSYAAERLERAGLNPRLPEGLSHASGTVMAVARAVRLETVQPGLAPVLSPLARGPVLLWVEEPVSFPPVPARGLGAVWEPSEELCRQLRRAYSAGLKQQAARAPLVSAVARGAIAELESCHRAEWWEAELDGNLDAVSERVSPEDLARLRAARPPPPPEDPLAAVVRRYEESQARTRAIAAKYNGYRRSAAAMSTAGIKGYLCPDCQQWFTWHPGCHPHQCPAEVRP